MLLSEMTTNVKTWVGQHPTAGTTLVEAILNDEYKNIAKAFYFDVLYYSENVTATVSQAYIDLVTNTTSYVVDAILDTTNDAPLVEQDEAWYDALEDPTEENVPENWVYRLNKIYLFPVPDAAYVYTIKGRKVPATITAAQTPVIPDEWHFVIEAQAAARVANMLGLTEVMMNAKNAALTRIAEITENRTYRRRNMTGQMNVTKVSVI